MWKSSELWNVDAFMLFLFQLLQLFSRCYTFVIPQKWLEREKNEGVDFTESMHWVVRRFRRLKNRSSKKRTLRTLICSRGGEFLFRISCSSFRRSVCTNTIFIESGPIFGKSILKDSKEFVQKFSNLRILRFLRNLILKNSCNFP